jgi:hypothetical protein
LAKTVSKRKSFNFTGGLNTEAGPLTSPPNAWADGVNVVPRLDGSVNKRAAINFETAYSLSSNSLSSLTEQQGAFVSWEWDAAGGDGTKNFVIVQEGSILRFYTNYGEGISPSENLAWDVTLVNFYVAGNEHPVGSAPCAFANAGGKVLVVNRDCDPFLISFNPATGVFRADVVPIEIRDLLGINDGLAINAQPTILNEQHQYNLKNQGWDNTKIGAFFASQSSYPSNVQVWTAGKDSNDDFDPALLVKQDFGTSAAPRGRYVLPLFNQDGGRGVTSGDIEYATNLTWNIRTGPLTNNKYDLYYVENRDEVWILDYTTDTIYIRNVLTGVEETIVLPFIRTSQFSGCIDETTERVWISGESNANEDRLVIDMASRAIIYNFSHVNEVFQAARGDLVVSYASGLKLKRLTSGSLQLVRTTAITGNQLGAGFCDNSGTFWIPFEDKVAFINTIADGSYALPSGELGTTRVHYDAVRHVAYIGTYHVGDDMDRVYKLDLATGTYTLLVEVDHIAVMTSLDYDARTDVVCFVRGGEDITRVQASTGAIIDIYTFDTANADIIIPEINDGVGSGQYMSYRSGVAFVHCSNGFLEIHYPGSAINFGLSNIEYNRPTCVEFYAGRAWYAGIESQSIASWVLFSQVAEGSGKYGKCYQDADPTSEFISDLVDSDGGVIPIQDAGNIVALKTAYNSVLVFADNGVWQINGGADTGFRATGYEVRRLSSAGCVAPRSVVMVEDSVLYFSNDGIWRIAPQNGVLTVVNITSANIQSFYTDIPMPGRANSSARYHLEEKCVYWLVNNDPDQDNTTRRFKKNSMLIFDTRLGSYYFHQISEVEESSPYIVDLVITKPRRGASATYDVVDSDGDTVVDGSSNQVVVELSPFVLRNTDVRFLTLVPDSTLFKVTFSAFDEGLVLAGLFHDWYSFNSAGVTYDAYALTGYDMGANQGGDTAMQGLYITCFFRRTEDRVDEICQLEHPSSCTMQARWNWADEAISGKWTAGEEVYRLRRLFLCDDDSEYNDGMPVVWSKSKIRGRGKAVQIKFTAHPDKDMQLLGWAVTYIGNQNV